LLSTQATIINNFDDGKSRQQYNNNNKKNNLRKYYIKKLCKKHLMKAFKLSKLKQTKFHYNDDEDDKAENDESCDFDCDCDYANSSGVSLYQILLLLFL